CPELFFVNGRTTCFCKQYTSGLSQVLCSGRAGSGEGREFKMYGKAVTGAGAGTSLLPATGFAPLWVGLAAFTMIAAGFTLFRLLPSLHRR
ncbi:MAG TPA: hypothetical protein VIV12_00530, partial [Streptosporangiaceae bacterium]